MEDVKSALFEFARNHKLCVISTAANDFPESALIGFVINKDLELVFNTETTTKKYKNLKVNPNVSIIIGFGENLKTLQCTGVAKELEGSEEGKILSAYADNLEFFRRWKIKYIKYFKVSLTWVRLSDYNEYPPKVIELQN